MDFPSMAVVGLMSLVLATVVAMRKVARTRNLSHRAKSAWSLIGFLVIIGLAAATWAIAQGQLQR
jgi:uncharacterized membrane protein